MSLIIHSLLHSEWGFFPWCLTFFKSATIRLDEFDLLAIIWMALRLTPSFVSHWECRGLRKPRF